MGVAGTSAPSEAVHIEPSHEAEAVEPDSGLQSHAASSGDEATSLSAASGPSPLPITLDASPQSPGDQEAQSPTTSQRHRSRRKRNRPSSFMDYVTY